jgi:hypothetical protein
VSPVVDGLVPTMAVAARVRRARLSRDGGGDHLRL